MAGGNFFGRVMSYLVNELIVDGLANSRAFQRFAVKTSKKIEDVSTLATKKKEELAEKMKELSKNFEMETTDIESEENVSCGNKGPSSSNSVGGNSYLGIGAKGNLEVSFLKYLEEQRGVADKSEIEIYLSDGMEKRDERFDLLKWWKINSTKFPILSQIARHVLGMPISTVASESAFSTGGRVIDPFRSSLTPKTAEALICSQDWIRSTPVDLELPDVHAKAIDELQEKLENLETDEFGSAPKFSEPFIVDD